MRVLALHRVLIPGSLGCLLLLFGSVICQGQKIDRKQPGVSITFQWFVKKTASEAYPTVGARLVLHNNTRWPIFYGKWLEPALPGDVAMGYVIENEDGCFVVRRHVDVVTRGKLLPGKTVSFTVPREDILTNGRVYVEFYFLWELTRGERNSDEATHRAYFRSSQLPRWPST